MDIIGKATEVRRVVGFTGDARLYTLDPPYEGTTQVIVSATVVPFGHGSETYIFKATEDGNDVADWCEMEGSFRGSLDHALALRNLGYEAVPA